MTKVKSDIYKSFSVQAVPKTIFKLSLINFHSMDFFRKTYRYLYAGLTFVFIGFVASVFIFLESERFAVQHEVQTEIKKSVPPEALDLLVFHKNEVNTTLNWKHDKEFEFNGEMFDVIYEQVNGDSVYYWCWADHEESALNKQMDQWVHFLLNGSSHSKDRQATINYFLHHLFTAQTSSSLSLMLDSNCKAPHLYHPGANQFHQEPQSPPPERIC